MTNPLNNLKHEADQIRMTHAEKSAMRAAIFGAPSPVRPQQSPYVFMSLSSVWMRSFAAVMLFILVGAGTASAAEGALPGDLLYPVKVSVNEKVQVALAPTPAAKAAVEATLASRRVEEAEALAAQGRLDATTTAALAANFDEHAQAAETLADAVEATDPSAGVQVKTTLAASLTAHSEILAKLGDESSSDSIKEHAGVLAARVIARAGGPARVAQAARAFAAAAPSAKMVAPVSGGAVSGSGQGGEAKVSTLSVSAEATSAPADNSLEQKTAASLESKAAIVLDAAKKLFDANKAKLDATSTAQVQGALAKADQAMGEGSSALGAGDYAAAAAQFTEVLRSSAQLSALLSAQAKYDNGIIRTLLKNDDGDAQDSSALELHF